MHTYPGGGLNTGILIEAKTGEILKHKKYYVTIICVSHHYPSSWKCFFFVYLKLAIN